MALATATPDGSPSVRMVLLKQLRRARPRLLQPLHVAQGPRARREPARGAPLPLVAARSPGARRGRRRCGCGEEESDAYFATRPRGAQIGASRRAQSEPLESRAVLEERLAELERDLADALSAAPAHVGRLPRRARTRGSSGSTATAASTTASATSARPAAAGDRAALSLESPLVPELSTRSGSSRRTSSGRARSTGCSASRSRTATTTSRRRSRAGCA